jgi:uncharacterized iron-regulated membrane protein
MRGFWLQVHLWLGLTLGAVGILVGLTGSLLVFDHAIDARLNPARYAVTGADASLPFSAYSASAAKSVEGRGRVVNLRLPEEEGLPVVALARGTEGRLYRVFLDPPTGKVLDAVEGGGLMGWTHRFHENLTLREYWGREVVGIVGIAMFVSSLTGLYLWWPGRARFRRALGLRAGVALTRNLHYLAGFYGSVMLALLSFTGIWLAYPNALGSPRNPQVAAEAPAAQGSKAGAKRLAPDDAVRIALEAYKEAKIVSVGFPGGPSGTYRVNLRHEARPVSVFVDPGSGKVLRRMDASTQTSGDRFNAWQRKLHAGDAFGGLWRWLLVATGVLPAILAISGLLLWLRRR